MICSILEVRLILCVLLLQESVHAQVAAVFGLIDEEQKIQLEDMQSELMNLIDDGRWSQAAKLRSRIVRYALPQVS